MRSGPRRLFAGRGISGPGAVATILVVIGAFAIGIAAGWGTTLFADRINQASPSTSPSPSASPSASPTPSMDVSVPPLEPVTREIDDADKAAGLRTLDYPFRGDGVLTPIAAPATSTPDEGVVEHVRIDVEGGLQMIDGTLANFVMTALNDPQGWGQGGTTTYVQTTGAPDVRIIFASPFTAAALCPTPHEPATLAPTSSASPSASPEASEDVPTVQCASQDTIVVSIYDWIQGLEPFAQDRDGARVFLLNHGLGHILGKADQECKKGVAEIMVNQRALPDKCTPNPWPFPAES
jgi:hypothetical protein